MLQKLPNIAIHLSRLRKALSFADYALRPGDGERSPQQRLLSCSADEPAETHPLSATLFVGLLKCNVRFINRLIDASHRLGVVRD
jgi:hypothetical protein